MLSLYVILSYPVLLVMGVCLCVCVCLCECALVCVILSVHLLLRTWKALWLLISTCQIFTIWVWSLSSISICRCDTYRVLNNYIRSFKCDQCHFFLQYCREGRKRVQEWGSCMDPGAMGKMLANKHLYIYALYSLTPLIHLWGCI